MQAINRRLVERILCLSVTSLLAMPWQHPALPEVHQHLIPRQCRSGDHEHIADKVYGHLLSQRAQVQASGTVPWDSEYLTSVVREMPRVFRPY